METRVGGFGCGKAVETRRMSGLTIIRMMV
jgi:hypothetical protein